MERNLKCDPASRYRHCSGLTVVTCSNFAVLVGSQMILNKMRQRDDETISEFLSKSAWRPRLFG